MPYVLLLVDIIYVYSFVQNLNHIFVSPLLFFLYLVRVIFVCYHVAS
jgi:hypothetical protein